MARESIEQKGRRMANEGKVTHDPHAAVYYVQGDTGTYTVIAGVDYTNCSCAARGRCSHMEAVRRSRVREYQGA